LLEVRIAKQYSNTVAIIQVLVIFDCTAFGGLMVALPAQKSFLVKNHFYGRF
jgi:hypothetical protein